MSTRREDAHLDGWRGRVPRGHQQASQGQFILQPAPESQPVLAGLDGNLLKALCAVVADEMEHHELGKVVKGLHCQRLRRSPVEDGAAHEAYAGADGEAHSC